MQLENKERWTESTLNRARMTRITQLVPTSLAWNEGAMKYVLQQANMLSIFRVQPMLCSAEGC